MVALAVLSGGVAAEAAPRGDHDRARSAVEAGEVRPLEDILARIRPSYPGRLLDARLRQRGPGSWLYDIRLLQPDGRVLALTVDARSGRVLGVRGHGGGKKKGRRR